MKTLFHQISFPAVCSYDDPGPHGAGGRYSEHMLPEIEFKDFRKGSQVFAKLSNCFFILSMRCYLARVSLFLQLAIWNYILAG